MWRLTYDEYLQYKKSCDIKNITKEKFEDACRIFSTLTGWGMFAYPHMLTNGTPFAFGVGYAELNPVIYGTNIDV